MVSECPIRNDISIIVDQSASSEIKSASVKYSVYLALLDSAKTSNQTLMASYELDCSAH
jgi:hypothetical protein